MGLDKFFFTTLIKGSVSTAAAARASGGVKVEERAGI